MLWIKEWRIGTQKREQLWIEKVLSIDASFFYDILRVILKVFQEKFSNRAIKDHFIKHSAL